MRTVTIILLAGLAGLGLLAACGDDGDAAAKAERIKALKLEIKAHNATYVEIQPGWREIRDKVIPARGAWLRAKGTDDEATAKEAFEQAAAAAQETIEAENAWKAKLRELEEELRRLGG